MPSPTTIASKSLLRLPHTGHSKALPLLGPASFLAAGWMMARQTCMPVQASRLRLVVRTLTPHTPTPPHPMPHCLSPPPHAMGHTLSPSSPLTPLIICCRSFPAGSVSLNAPGSIHQVYTDKGGAGCLMLILYSKDCTYIRATGAGVQHSLWEGPVQGGAGWGTFAWITAGVMGLAKVGHTWLSPCVQVADARPTCLCLFNVPPSPLMRSLLAGV